jgi:hypothetical protein
MEPFMEINEAVIKDLLESTKNPPSEFLSLASQKIKDFKEKSKRKPVSNELKLIYSSVFAELNNF